MASRWDKGDTKDYINCPMTKEQYLAFRQGLLDGDKTEFKEWEKDTPYFEGCMPIEVMAERGVDTLRYGPMKPVGLDDPRTGRWPHAVVQLRQDNALGTLWNMVGFQTKLKHAEQVRLFRTIPGLEKAEFARLGGLHRNTFINSPRLLDGTLRLKAAPHIRFAGQITGCEGYVESAAIGLIAGRFAAADLAGEAPAPPPLTTALGALLGHITGGADAASYQPMNVNFGLFAPPRRGPRNDARRSIDAGRANLEAWLDSGCRPCPRAPRQPRGAIAFCAEASGAARRGRGEFGRSRRSRSPSAVANRSACGGHSAKLRRPSYCCRPGRNSARPRSLLERTRIIVEVTRGEARCSRVVRRRSG